MVKEGTYPNKDSYIQGTYFSFGRLSQLTIDLKMQSDQWIGDEVIGNAMEIGKHFHGKHHVYSWNISPNVVNRKCYVAPAMFVTQITHYVFV